MGGNLSFTVPGLEHEVQGQWITVPDVGVDGDNDEVIKAFHELHSFFKQRAGKVPGQTY